MCQMKSLLPACLNFRCKESKMTLYAEVHPPALYEAPAQLNASMNSSVPEELTQNSTTQPQLPSSTSAGRALHTPWTSSPPTSMAEVSASAALSGLEVPSTAGPEPEEASPTRKQPVSDPRGTTRQ